MSDELTPFGSVHISPKAIATIAFHAARVSYGVVGLASKNLMDGLAHSVAKDPTHGVDVHYDGETVNVDIYIIVEYGTRIKSVADSVSNTVRYQIEKALGMPIHEVNVHVHGLRISDLD